MISKDEKLMIKLDNDQSYTAFKIRSGSPIKIINFRESSVYPILFDHWKLLVGCIISRKRIHIVVKYSLPLCCRFQCLISDAAYWLYLHQSRDSIMSVNIHLFVVRSCAQYFKYSYCCMKYASCWYMVGTG